jgi:hypothetical protein
MSLTKGMANMKPENASHRGPYLSERYPMAGEMKEGIVRARNIRPAPTEFHYLKVRNKKIELGVKNVGGGKVLENCGSRLA